jgi:hypothetical protein
MLPDFLELKAELSDFISEFFQQRVSHHLGALSEIGRQTVFEGPVDANYGQQLVRDTGEVESFGLNPISTEISIPLNRLPEMTLDEVLMKVDETAQDFAKELAQFHYKRMSEILAGTETSIDAKGRKLSAELILEFFSKMDIDFDQRGNPKMPTVHLHPKLRDAYNLAINELASEPELRREFERMLIQKKEEWRGREADRKLVG